MKYIFRGYVIFEYIPNEENRERGQITQHDIPDTEVAGFNYCAFTTEDYFLLSQFFNTIYNHMKGKDVLLYDITVR